MSLSFYYHPLASFCHKVLIALYEKQLPFEKHIVDLGNPDASADFIALWPVGKIPVMHDGTRDQVVPETTIILEYLEAHYPGACRLLPESTDQAIETRLWDRFLDLYVQVPMQKIVTDRLWNEEERDPRGVREARQTLATAYDMLENRMRQRRWVAGGEFSIADCAAAPALFYAGIVEPFPTSHANLSAYFERLFERQSFKRVLEEAKPYFANFPYRDAMPARFLE